MRSTTVLFATAAFAIASGCVASDGPSLIVGGAVAFDDDCTADADSPTFLIGGGSFQAQLGVTYIASVQLVSHLAPRTEPGVGQPNYIFVTGAEVELQEPGGLAVDFGGLQNPFTVDVSVTVPPEGAAIVGVPLIPASHATALASQLGAGPASKTIVATVQFFGETAGGVDIEAAPWSFPITAYSGFATYVCDDSADASGCLPCQDGRPCLRACSTCTVDTDCAPGEVCRAETCERPCASDAECGGQPCLSGVCF